MPRWIEALRAAFAAGDPQRLASEYDRLRHRPLLAPLLRLAEATYPVREIVHLAPELDARIASHSLATASRWLLDTHFTPWRAEIPEAAAAVLSSRPAVIYGNHPSMLTPFLISAAVNRDDLRILSASYVHLFLPRYARYSLPVEIWPPRRGGWMEYLRSGVPALLQTKLLALLLGTAPVADAKERNLNSILRGADHVAGGGCLLLAPGAGSARPRAWYQGIGRIARKLAEDGAGERVFLIPYHEEHISKRRVCASLRRNRRAWVQRRFVYRRPVTVRFAEPQLLATLVPRPDDPAAITARLHAHYRELFPR